MNLNFSIFSDNSTIRFEKNSTHSNFLEFATDIMQTFEIKNRIAKGEIELISAYCMGSSKSYTIWKEFRLIKQKGVIQKEKVYCSNCLKGFKIHDSTGNHSLLISIKQ